MLVFGTDGEESLYEASALQQEVQKIFLDDVFGRRIDDGRMGGGKLNSSFLNSRYVHASLSFTISKRVFWRGKRALRTRLLEQ